LGEKQKSGRLNKVKYTLNANENAIKQVEAKEYWQHFLKQEMLTTINKSLLKKETVILTPTRNADHF
jgi:hypothetical protein